MIKDILKYWYVFVFLLLISMFFIFNEFINNKNNDVIDNALEEINKVEEKDSLENINVRVIKKEVKTNVIIIDHKLIWYGEINPFSYNYKDSFSIIRLEDREYADTIIKEVDVFR